MTLPGKRSTDLLKAKRAKGRAGNQGTKRSPFGAAGTIVFFVAAAVLALGAVAITADAAPQGRIMRGVTSAGFALGGMDATRASQALRDRMRSYYLSVSANGTRKDIALDEKTAKFDADATAAAAIALSNGNPLRRIVRTVRTSVTGIDIPVSVTVDRQELRSRIASAFSELAAPAQDAHITITVRDDGGVDADVMGEHDGATIDYSAALRDSESRLRSLSQTPVELRVARERPRVTSEQARALLPGIGDAIARAPLTVTAGKETFRLTKRQIADWIDAIPSDGGARLGLVRPKTDAFLSSRTADQAVTAKNATFEMTDGKVTSFVPSFDGTAIDLDASADAIGSALFGAPPQFPVALPFKTVPPEITTESANPYGIKEVIGIGATNFKGSPKNRVHNIGVGAAAVNGTIVMPGEQFSLLKTLGKIDATTGYLEELVIKENKTTPEFGGGLCQIGSTTFRAALASGLPILVRQNHSYRVPYYERDGDGKFIGPGKDATIYDPAPDFKFANDTGSAIMIMTAIDGNRLTFTFWGRRDGRRSAQTDARVYNIVPPPEKKLVGTTDLPPGTQKCTEKPHEGSDAVFTYTVIYPDGTVKTKDFRSHYKPWGEVCLVGIDPNAPPIPGGPSLPSADAAGAMGN